MAAHGSQVDSILKLTPKLLLVHLIRTTARMLHSKKNNINYHTFPPIDTDTTGRYLCGILIHMTELSKTTLPTVDEFMRLSMKELYRWEKFEELHHDFCHQGNIQNGKANPYKKDLHILTYGNYIDLNEDVMLYAHLLLLPSEEKKKLFESYFNASSGMNGKPFAKDINGLCFKINNDESIVIAEKDTDKEVFQKRIAPYLFDALNPIDLTKLAENSQTTPQDPTSSNSYREVIQKTQSKKFDLLTEIHNNCKAVIQDREEKIRVMRPSMSEPQSVKVPRHKQGKTKAIQEQQQLSQSAPNIGEGNKHRDTRKPYVPGKRPY